MQTRQRTISYTRRQRLLVRRLVELLAHRHEVQERLDREHEQGVAAAREACEQRTRDLTDLRDHASYTAEQERQGALSLVRPPLEEELAQARQKMDAEISAFAARSNSMLKVAGERLEEAKWLAETLVESGQSAARARFEAVQRVIQKRVSELEQMRETASAMLAQGRYGAVPESADAQNDGSDASPADAPVPQLLEQLEKDCVAAEEAVERLHRRAQPPLLSVPGIFSGAATAAGAAALWMMWQAVDPQAGAVGQAAAIGFAGGLAVMIVVRLAARQRVPAAAAKCGAAIGHAMATARRALAQATAERERDVRAAHARAEQELREAQAQYMKVRREVDRRRESEAPQLRERHQAIVNTIQERLNAAVAEIDGVYRQRTQEAQERWTAGVAEAEQERDQRIGDLDAAHESGWRALVEHWQTTMEELEAEYTALRSRAQALWPAWDALLGRDALEDLPPAARFAGLEVDLRALPGGVPEDARLPLTIPERLELAATLDLLGRGSLLLEHPPEARAQAIAALNAAMLRLLTTFPPGKVRFTILDPVGLGESFAAFMHLADHEPALVSDRIWTDQRHIEQKLADLTEHMETVIQKYLRNEYESIQDYNAEAGEIAEPFRFLVIADFPANFSEAAMKRLSSILSSGSRCGVFTLIATDTSGGVDAGLRVRGGSSRLPHWIPMEDVRRAGNMLTWRAGGDDGDAGGFVWDDEDFGRFAMQMEDLPDADLLTRLLHEAGRRAKDSSRVQVPFGSVAPGMEAIWSRSAATELEVPLGRSGARKVQELSLGRGTTQHALIAGRTGSGKSNLLHVLITNVALWYSPSEVELYLVDFKKGVEFKTYAVHGLPHARVIAIESEREFGLSALRRLDAELTRRGTLFRDAGGGGVQDIATYRRETGKTLPRIVLIVDEFQEFFVEDDRIAQEASLLLDRLVRQGRAFGMHVVLGSQTLGGAYSIARSTIGQMAVRVALQCSESDCYLIMSEDNSAPRLLSRPGEAIYNDASGLVEGNSPFQVVFLPDEVRDRWLPKVSETAARAGLPARPDLIVFEGNVPANLEQCGALMQAIGGSGVRRADAQPTIWLGEPVSIKEPTSVTFQRQSGSNVIAVGQQDEAALALVFSAALSLSALRAPGGDAVGASGNGELLWPASGGIVVFDGSPPETPAGAVLQEIGSRVAGVRMTRPRQSAALVGELEGELQRREQEEAQGRSSFAPLFVLVYGLQRFRDLRRPDDFSFGLDERGSSASAQFTRLLRDGPLVGIHTIAWCDTVANLDRTLERSALREFEARVLFQMSATDSTHLMDTPQAGLLGRHRALLYHEDAGTAERFRPWALPDAAVRQRLLAAAAGSGAVAARP